MKTMQIALDNISDHYQNRHGMSPDIGMQAAATAALLFKNKVPLWIFLKDWPTE